MRATLAAVALILCFGLAAVASFGQTAGSAPDTTSNAKAPAIAPRKVDKAAAYYHYTLGHMYETMLREMRGDCTAGGSKIVAAFVERASMTIFPPLTVSNPRVEHRVENIDNQIDDDHEKNHEQNHALDDNEIPGADRVQQQIADAGIIENGLNNGDQPAQISHLQPHHCKCCHERVA